MAAAKPALQPFCVNMERIQIPRAKIGGAGRNNPTNQLPVDSPPPRPAIEIPLSPSKQEEDLASRNNNNDQATISANHTGNTDTSKEAAPKIVVSQSAPPEPAIDYD